MLQLKNLDSLLTMLDIVDPAIALTVPKFAAVSLQAVFADVLPSYPIKHHNPEGVKRMRTIFHTFLVYGTVWYLRRNLIEEFFVMCRENGN